MGVELLSFPPGRRIRPATPASLANLVAWGEGSDLGNDGTGIASWLNKTGSGLDPAQATGANQPTVKANAINGQKAAWFAAASSKYLLFPAGAAGWYNGVAGGTMLVVCAPLSIVNAQIIDVAMAASAPARFAIAEATTAVQSVTRSNDSTLSTTTGSASLVVNTPAIIGAISDAANGTQSVLFNGAIQNSGAVSPAQNFPSTNSLGISLGARQDGTSFVDMYIAAYAMWTTAYSRAQLAGVLLRWSQLYGIALS